MHFDFTFRSRRSNVMALNGMSASSQPLASLAGLDILRAGGSAADAAVAIAAMLNVVEPFSTGVGGDCFVLYWDESEKKVHALNASGPAPQKASIEEIKSLGYQQYPLYTGQAVSVPGTVAGWAALINRFGRMKLADVLRPAIHCAAMGYPVTEWIGSGWQLMEKHLSRNSVDEDLPKHSQRIGPPQASAKEFLIDGHAPRVGDMMQLPTFAETLQGIADEGKDYIYEGAFARKLCEYVQRYQGWLEPTDLSGFEAEWVIPIHADYHHVRLYECPPNGQGLAAILAVKIAEGFDLAPMNPIDRTHILIECMRLGFADAFKWVSDPQFNRIPYDELFSSAYIDSQRKRIKLNRAIDHLPQTKQAVGDDTVYLSVVDREGNACSFINSLYMGGGTGLIVPGTGVFLQNRAALFSLDPDHPNALEGGKRPYHTIIPAMLTQNGELLASFGIMGGFMQPQAHLQVLSNLVDKKYNPQQALDMHRFCINVNNGSGIGAADQGGEVFLEDGFGYEVMAALRSKGHIVSAVTGRQRGVFGGGQIIMKDSESSVLIAGSDPRKDGCAIGY